MKDYKKILQGIIDIINTTEKSDIGFTNICAYLGEKCPELKESEDERIRKNCIHFLDLQKSHHASTFEIDECIAWLEKQSESEDKGEIISDGHGGFTTKKELESGQCITTCDIVTHDTVDKDPEIESDFVDLGLPSGTLWATCNVGAKKPEEYGDYFTWWEAMKLDCTLPTKEQVAELIIECSSVRTTQNGKKGRLFTGPNGNTLFLPAAGYYDGGGLYNAASCGYYWSSSLYSDYPGYACGLYFNSGGVSSGYAYRCYGRSARPVKSK